MEQEYRIQLSNGIQVYMRNRKRKIKDSDIKKLFNIFTKKFQSIDLTKEESEYFNNFKKKYVSDIVIEDKKGNKIIFDIEKTEIVPFQEFFLNLINILLNEKNACESRLYEDCEFDARLDQKTRTETTLKYANIRRNLDEKNKKNETTNNAK